MEIFIADVVSQNQGLLAGGLWVCLTGAGFWDLRKGRIPNGWLLFWFITGFVVSAWDGGRVLLWYLIRCGVLIGIFFPLFLFRMIGAGDIKCMALIGGYLGFLSASKVIGIGLVIGAVWSFIKLAVKRSFWERFLYLTAYVRRVYCEKRITAYYVRERDGKAVTIPLAFCLMAGFVVLEISHVVFI